MAIDQTALTVTAATLVASDKGLLAMDESNPTCNKRFALLGIPQTPLLHRALCNRAARRGEYDAAMESATSRRPQ
jgi:fructose-bisphosphate aldolase class 1